MFEMDVNYPQGAKVKIGNLQIHFSAEYNPAIDFSLLFLQDNKILEYSIDTSKYLISYSSLVHCLIATQFMPTPGGYAVKTDFAKIDEDDIISFAACISVMRDKWSRYGMAPATDDFELLGTLVEDLNKMVADGAWEVTK